MGNGTEAFARASKRRQCSVMPDPLFHVERHRLWLAK